MLRGKCDECWGMEQNLEYRKYLLKAGAGTGQSFELSNLVHRDKLTNCR